MTTIRDSKRVDELASAILEADGRKVAQLATSLIGSGRHALVRKACLETCHVADPRHCNALVQDLVEGARKRSAPRCLSRAVATIVAGRRARTTGAPAPACKPASVLARLEVAVEDGRVPALALLPARPGKVWSALVALASEAVRGGVEQEDAVDNAMLEDLFRNGPSETGSDRAYKLGVLSTFTRNRVPARERVSVRVASCTGAPESADKAVVYDVPVCVAASAARVLKHCAD